MKDVYVLGRELAIVSVLMVCTHVLAGELVYTPTNPTFGGNPNNAAGLLAVANAQNDYKAPSTTKAPLTALEKFTASVQTAVLSKLSRNAVEDIFNADTGEPILDQTITAGNFTVKFQNEGTNLVMLTRDNVTGGESKIVIGAATGE
jgi:curli production assembly/transport component CsgF